MACGRRRFARNPSSLLVSVLLSLSAEPVSGQTLLSWLRNHDDGRDLKAKRQFHILCYGDSLTAGLSPAPGKGGEDQFFPYAEYLQQALDEDQSTDLKFQVEHKGLPGKKTAQLLEEEIDALDKLIRDHKPQFDFVILMAGTNDVFSQVGNWSQTEELGAFTMQTPGTLVVPQDEIQLAATEITNNLMALHAIAEKEGVPQSLQIEIPPSKLYSSDRNAARLMDAIHHQLLEQVPNDNNMNTFIHFPLFYGGRHHFEYWAHDGVHLTEQGYQAFGKALAPYVLKLVKEA